MSSRELLVMIEELPEDSRTMRAYLSAWTTAERLSAINANILHGIRADYRQAHEADYEYEPVEPPELEYQREARIEAEAARESRGKTITATLDAMLRGEIRMEDVPDLIPA